MRIISDEELNRHYQSVKRLGHDPINNKVSSLTKGVVDGELHDTFHKYLTNDGNNYTIRIGKQVVKVKDEDFKELKQSLKALIKAQLEALLAELPEKRKPLVNGGGYRDEDLTFNRAIDQTTELIKQKMESL